MRNLRILLITAIVIAAVFASEAREVCDASHHTDSTAVVRDDTVFLFRFKSRTSMFFMHFDDNEPTIRAAAEMIERNREAIRKGDMYVVVHGYCSSFLTEYSNMAMARNRSNQVKSYYITNHGLKEDNYRTKNHTVPYNGDKDVVAMMRLEVAYGSTPPRKISENQCFAADTTVSVAETANTVGSMNLAKEQAPTDLTRETESAVESTIEMSPKRTEPVEPEANIVSGGKTDTAIAADSVAIVPVSSETVANAEPLSADNGAATNPSSETVAHTSVTSDDAHGESVSRVSRQENAGVWRDGRWNLKTNIPFWALVVPNIAVEYRFADHWSVDVPIYYMAGTVARNYRFRTLAVQPSVRYWLKPEMNGHFFGVHLSAGQFNISVDKKNRYQDVNGMYGAGIDYGYALKFNDRWGMEFNIGAGYIYTKYNTYYNIDNGARFDTDRKNYFGVTRLGISVIYRIK